MLFGTRVEWGVQCRAWHVMAEVASDTSSGGGGGSHVDGVRLRGRGAYHLKSPPALPRTVPYRHTCVCNGVPGACPPPSLAGPPPHRPAMHTRAPRVCVSVRAFGGTQVKERCTHARPGMPMQRCSAVRGLGGGGSVSWMARRSPSSAAPSPMPLPEGEGPPKVRCGPAAVLQPRPPPHGLHRLLSSGRVRLASECPKGPLCCSLSSRGSGKGPGDG